MYMWLNIHLSFHSADENIRSVWNDEETITFFKLIHDANITYIYIFLHLHVTVPLLLQWFNGT